MGSLSIWHWLIVLILVGVYLVPGWLIAKKAGFGGAWSLLLLIPLVNIIAIWMFALVRWPVQRESI